MALLEQLHVRRLLTNGASPRTPTATAIWDRAIASGLVPTPLAAGMRLGGLPGLTIEVLHPPSGLMPGTEATSNDNSLVLRLARGRVSLLLCADVDEQGLHWLLRSPAALRSMVLQLPHHGSDVGSALESWLDAVHPRVALISVGWRSHLPNPRTLSALAARGIPVFTTRRDGAITVRTDGRRLLVTTYQHG